MNTIQPKPRSLTDSAGFWLVLFSGFGLVMLTLLGPKIADRLGRNDRAAEFQLRKHGAVKEERAPQNADDSEAKSDSGTKNGINGIPSGSDKQITKVSSQSSLIIIKGILLLGLVAGICILIFDRRKKSQTLEPHDS